MPVFTQLVFSWNALRPKKGYFTFYAQVRNADTKKWSKWHRMMNWGADIQKSFKTESDKFSSYQHVRLESNTNIMADAFAIKIEAHDGADLSLIKSFAVNLSNFTEFNPEHEQIMAAASQYLLKECRDFHNLSLIIRAMMVFVRQLHAQC